MEKSVLLPLAYGSEEVEAITVADLLRRADIKVTIAGESDMVTCSRGVKIIPDILLTEVSEYETFGAIVLPGGGAVVDAFIENEHLVEIVKHNIDKGSLICAICAAPLFLKHHNLIDDTIEITSFPDVESELSHPKYSNDAVVVSGNFITSRGVGTAIEFALKIIERMVSKEKAESIAKEIVYKS